MEYRPAAWDVSPLMSTARGAATVGPRTPFSPERPVGVHHFVEDSLSYPERDELAIQLVDTATMAPGIDEISNRESATSGAPMRGRNQLTLHATSPEQSEAAGLSTQQVNTVNETSHSATSRNATSGVGYQLVDILGSVYTEAPSVIGRDNVTATPGFGTPVVNPMSTVGGCTPCLVSTTTTEGIEAVQVTPTDVDGTHRSRSRVRRAMRLAQPSHVALSSDALHGVSEPAGAPHVANASSTTSPDAGVNVATPTRVAIPSAANATSSPRRVNVAHRYHRRSYSSSSSPEAHRRHRLRPRAFDGTGSFESFWAQFENCATYNRWTPVDKLAHLKDALTGDAGQILWDTDASATDSVEKLVTLLKNRYSGSRQTDKYRMELRLRRRQPGETLSALHRDVRRLMALAHPSLPEDARDTIATDYYIDGLDDPDFALKIRERNPASLDDALRIALQLEAWSRDSKRNRGEVANKTKVRSASFLSDDVNIRLTRIENDLQKCVETLANVAQLSSQVTRQEVDVDRPQQVTDVAIRTQPHANAQPHRVASQPTVARSTNKSKTVCWACGEPGHVQRNCTNPRPQPNATQPDVRGLKKPPDDPAYLEMTLASKKVLCLMDSGCHVTLVPQSLVESVRSLHVKPVQYTLRAANETDITVVGEVNLPLRLDGRHIRTPAFVSPDVEELMLGLNWLRKHRCMWDFAGNKIYVDGYAAVPVASKRITRCRRVYVQDTVVLAPNQETDVIAHAPLRMMRYVGGERMVDTRRVRPGVYVGRTLLLAAIRNLKVRMLNTSAKPKQLPKGALLGELKVAHVVDSIETQEETPTPDVSGCIVVTMERRRRMYLKR